MRNRSLIIIIFFSLYSFSNSLAQNVTGSRKEVFKQTTLSGANVLDNPWEITYGPDGYLWITEAKGYKVWRMDPNTPNTKTQVLDLSPTSTDLTAFGADSLLSKNKAGETRSPWNSNGAGTNNAPFPQGGLAGLALHPDFANPANAYVYISYVHRFLGGAIATYGTYAWGPGLLFRNKLVRFKYNSVSGKLENPVVLCDTLPGSNDHNSQRMIIARTTPGGPYYLFYASGDMGAGQFGNRYKTNRAQDVNSYEGKILRFNLEPDGDAGAAAWIPNDNPYGAGTAVYSIGIRNNQGFAYDSTLNILYGSSHGAYSDDEIDIIMPKKNYGHPLISGFASDGNYNGNSTANSNGAITLGTAFQGASKDYGNSSLSPVVNELTNKNTINTFGNTNYGDPDYYQDPIYCAYPTPLGTSTTSGTIAYIWANNIGGGGSNWASEAWSGLGLYDNTYIPGWHKSLVAASLKWGRLVRLKMNATGTSTLPSNNHAASDTVLYFQTTNRYRDMAFSNDGKDIFIVMDKDAVTSGPSSGSPITPDCAGCVIKYSFLGYADNSGKSSIPTSIAVTTAATNQCITGTTVVVNNDNKTLWVPITGPDGNILAEIYPNNNVLGNVTSSFYLNGSGSVRSKSGKPYLDRNITITPQNSFSGSVKVRLYITKAEYDALKNTSGSGVSAITDVKIFKNSDACSSAISSALNTVTMDFSMEAFGTDAYVLQGTVTGFSTFYFGSNSLTTLPLSLITFSGSLQNNNSVLLKWKTENEVNTSSFEIERSIDGIHYDLLGIVPAKGNGEGSSFYYQYNDMQAANQQSSILHYRLKMVDADGKYSYSNIVFITLNNPLAKVSIAPNPVRNKINVTISSPLAGKAKWKITDNTGRVLMQNSIELLTGINNVDINASGLAGGVYYLVVSGSGIEQKIRFQKL